VTTKRKYQRIINIPAQYLDVIPIGTRLFPALYQFENALRLAVDKHLTVCYGNWWEHKLKFDLPDIYNYAEDVKQKHSKMPWIGDSARVTTLPLHNITLGQLGQIVEYYKSDCIPQLFSSLDFFTGHMRLIKLVRNLYSHMFPCLTSQDAKLARNEITTLCASLKSKI
jgi:hypothetical protein